MTVWDIDTVATYPPRMIAAALLETVADLVEAKARIAELEKGEE